MGDKLVSLVTLLVQLSVSLALMGAVFMLSWNNFVHEVWSLPELDFVNSVSAVVSVYLTTFVARMGSKSESTVTSTVVNNKS